MNIKGISWIGVGTDDFERSLRFFTQTLGFKVETQRDDQAILRIADGQLLEIFGRDGPGKRLNSPPTVAFEVEDVAAARDALQAGGAEILGEIGHWAGHEWLYFRSPDGHIFEVKSTPGSSVSTSANPVD